MTTLDTNAKGVYPIAVTPFSDDGALDLTSSERCVAQNRRPDPGLLRPGQ